MTLTAYGNELLGVFTIEQLNTHIRSLTPKLLDGLRRNIGCGQGRSSYRYRLTAPLRGSSNPRHRAIKVLRRVESGKLDMGLGMFRRVLGVRRIPFCRFSLMLIRPDKDGAQTTSFHNVRTQFVDFVFVHSHLFGSPP